MFKLIKHSIASILVGSLVLLTSSIGYTQTTLSITETFDQQIIAQEDQSFGFKNQLTFELDRNGTFLIPGNGIAEQTSESYLDSAIIRSTIELPDTYVIRVTIGNINYGLNNIEGIPNDPSYSEGPTNENGVYLLAIVDESPTLPHTNLWWHEHRKVSLDVDNNVWGEGMPNPLFMVYFDNNNELVCYDGETNSWDYVNWINSIHYEENAFYQVEIEKTTTNFILRVLTEDGQVLEEGAVPLSEVWHGQDSSPDYLVIGDPHENYYQGSVTIKDITMPVSLNVTDMKNLYEEHECQISFITWDEVCYNCDCQDYIDKDLYLHYQEFKDLLADPQPDPIVCVPDGTCTAEEPACDTITYGLDSCYEECMKVGEDCACIPDGSCSAFTPACGEITHGIDNCSNTCTKIGESCPETCATNPSYCQKRNDCVANGYYWYGGTCNKEPKH